MTQGAREIQRGDCEISEAVRSGQVAMFDLAGRKHGLVKLARVPGFPNTMLSLPFEAAGKAISDAEQDETDIDNAVIAAARLVLRYVEARHPDSPAGIRLCHTEKPDLKLAVDGVADKVSKVAGR